MNSIVFSAWLADQNEPLLHLFTKFLVFSEIIFFPFLNIPILLSDVH